MRIEKIENNLFRITIPLPDSPLGNVNVYVIRSAHRHLIIDTGVDTDHCRKALFSALDTLGVKRSRLDIFLTHCHLDHVGQVENLITADTMLYIHRSGWKSVRTWNGYANAISFAEKNGFPIGLMKDALANHPGNRPGYCWKIDPTLLLGGEILEVGDFRLKVIATPGHSSDHLCLYESGRKILFSGDHLLSDITPIIASWGEDDDDSLRHFMDSLHRTADLDIALVLPAHRGKISDHRKRIEELLAHHHHRLADIQDILVKHPQTTYEIASQLRWNDDTKTWEHLSLVEKWFATMEVIAHLKFLEKNGQLASPEKDKYFRPVTSVHPGR